MARKRKKSRSKKKQRKAKAPPVAEATESSAGDGDQAQRNVDADGDIGHDGESEPTPVGVDPPAADLVDDVHFIPVDDDVVEVPPGDGDVAEVLTLDGDDGFDVISLDDDEPEIISDDDDEPEVISLDDDDDDPEELLAETLAYLAAEEGAALPSDSTSHDPPPDDEGSVSGEEEGSGVDALQTEGPAEEATRPKITYDAVAALSQMQAEGLIDLPSNLVIDLGEATTEEDRDRLLSALLAHVEMQEARYRVPLGTGRPRRWKGTVASAVVTLAMLVAVAPPSILVPDPPVVVTEADRTYGVLVALLVQAQQVDAFRVREQRLPDDLSEVGASLHDIRFVKSSNRLYQLVAYTTDGIAVVYDSAAPSDIFRRVADTWVTTQEGM